MDRSEFRFALAHVEQEARHMLSDWLIDATPFPVMVLDGSARILFANRPAQAILTAQDGIEHRDDKLRLQRPEDEIRFLGLLRASGADAASEVSVMRIDRPSGKRRYALSMFRPPAQNPMNALWIVFVSDTSERMTLQPRWIEAMFGVTKGEARVLALVSEGMSAEDIAVTLEIATATVRVHLRNVYRKLKVNRQSDLVATILKSIMPMCAWDTARAARGLPEAPKAPASTAA